MRFDVTMTGGAPFLFALTGTAALWPAAWLFPALILVAALCYTGTPLRPARVAIAALLLAQAVGQMAAAASLHRVAAAAGLTSVVLAWAGVAVVVRTARRERKCREELGGTPAPSSDDEGPDRQARSDRILFEQSSDAHLIFDEVEGIIDCNPATVRMLRCADKRAVLALHPAELSPEYQPDGRRSLEKCVEMDATARRDGHHRFDWVHRRADGEDFPCEVTLTPIAAHGRSVLLVVWHDLTERKRAEDALRESEERFRAFMDNMPLAAWVVGSDGRVAMANAQLGRLLGIPADRLVGLDRGAFHPPELAAEHEANDRRVLDTGRPVEAEERFTRPDGSRGTALVVKFPIRGLVAGVALDVTDRQRAEDALRYQTALLRSLTESGPDGILVVEPGGRILSSNRQFLRVWGFPPDLAVGDEEGGPLAAAVARVADPDAFLARVRTLSADPDAEAVDEVPLADGRVLERHTGPVRGADGRLYGRVWYFRDVTARKRAELALRESEERNRKLALVASRTENAVVITDAGGEVEWVNDGFVRMSGYAPDEVIGRYPGDVLRGPDTDPETVRYMGERMRRREGFAVEILNYARGGRPYWVAFDARPVFDDIGALTCWVAIQRDVTAARAAADELRRAKEAAEAANRAKGEFLANVSHELRTPLNGIIGLTDLALGGDLSGDQRDRLELVRESADGLLAIVNDLLDLAKIEAGKLDLAPARFDPHEVVEGVARAFALRAAQKGLELACDVGPDVPRAAVGDAHRLRQVLTNLIGNAIKFTHRGGVRVAARVAARGANELALSFAVADTGIGIPADKLGDVFRPFEQADGSTTRRYGGTGLGLSIVDRLTRLMGGTVQVESVPGAGSTFTATARFAPAGGAAVPQAAPPSVSGGVAATPPPARQLRLLMAEDNRVNQRVAEGLLSRAGHAIVIVEDGAAAVAAWERGGFDAILMDVQMPVMGGLEATAAIRELERAAPAGRRPTPIVALTARAMVGDEEACLAAGMDAFLTKPIDAPRLLRVLTRLTADRPPAPAAPTPAPAPATGAVYDLGRIPPAIRGELIGLFLAEAPEPRAVARDAVAAHDLVTAERAAHRLVGAAANFGAAAAVAAARRLEAAARDRTLPDARVALVELEVELDRLFVALRSAEHCCEERR